MNNNQAIVLSSGISWGSILTIVRSLGRRNVEVYVVGIGCDVSQARFSRYCKGVRLFQDSCNGGFVEFLEWIESDFKDSKPVLFITSDILIQEYINERSRADKVLTFVAPVSSILKKMLIKTEVNRHVSSLGFLVPQFWELLGIEDILRMSRDIPFPVIVKPLLWKSDQTRIFKGIICSSFEQLRDVVYEPLQSGSKFIVQKFIQGGDDQLYFILFSRNVKGESIYCTGRKIQQGGNGVGVMASGVSEHNTELVLLCEMFLNSVDYIGPGGLEFKKNEHGYMFIELNPRFEGILAIAAHSGVDLVWHYYCGAIGVGGCDFSMPQVAKGYIAEDEYIWSFRYAKNRIRFLKKTYNDVIYKGVSFSIFDKKDFVPFFAILYSGVVKIVRARFNKLIAICFK